MPHSLSYGYSLSPTFLPFGPSLCPAFSYTTTSFVPFSHHARTLFVPLSHHAATHFHHLATRFHHEAGWAPANAPCDIMGQKRTTTDHFCRLCISWQVSIIFALNCLLFAKRFPFLWHYQTDGRTLFSEPQSKEALIVKPVKPSSTWQSLDFGRVLLSPKKDPLWF